MHTRILLLFLFCSLLPSLNAQQKLTLVDGVYYTDSTQTKSYTGDYLEYYPSGALRLEVSLKDGKPQGSYVVYFENGRPQEVRGYKYGQFNGLWRTYTEVG
ncbi:MAG: toxin-antitoxin system YwqK family antitoxin, partial [Tannerellaceae bacterium]